MEIEQLIIELSKAKQAFGNLEVCYDLRDDELSDMVIENVFVREDSNGKYVCLSNRSF